MAFKAITFFLIPEVIKCLPTLLFVGSTPSNSLDLVGSAADTCYMKFTSLAASKACDFNMATNFKGLFPYPAVALGFDRAFYVQFGSTIQIRSFMGDINTNGALVDVFVSYGAVVRGDTRYLCRSNLVPNGVFNCPATMKGTHLVFWPLATEEPGNMVFREVRAWSRQDLAGTGTVVLGVGAVLSTSGPLQELVGSTPTLDNSFEL